MAQPPLVLSDFGLAGRRGRLLCYKGEVRQIAAEFV
jgi:hypothetical protein